MAYTINHTEVLETEVCCNCGILFAMPQDFKQMLLSKPLVKKFYCPNGHEQWYTGKSPEAKLREAEAELSNERGRRRLAEENAEKARVQAKREATRRKNVQARADAGVCQHCHRQFKDVAGHMERKHPDHFPKGMRGRDKLALKALPGH